ncbi:hypothetical protein KUL25_17580 [Rhodobacteraceae bacterium N5(2021)]|uniref:Uncharacterized protein n=1 Tax=Gymnodinialimonas phycosphaerae TaxID=2841589 RepID=A0A975YFB8_9RHOB|nr:hypothetical protein [Gymnodinialimonas phycosphaerae]MBY4894573.1 hypothetical protein [Gymnodinialimonas phycosphaerae]
MLHDLAEPEMRKIIDQARAERSREIARLFAQLFRRRAKTDLSVAATG